MDGWADGWMDGPMSDLARADAGGALLAAAAAPWAAARIAVTTVQVDTCTL
jgi:hypothetical protein